VREDIIQQRKEQGVLAGERGKRVVTLQIPPEAGNFLSDRSVKVPMIGSWLGALFTINYLVRVYVKHQKWDQLGRGKCCFEIPVKIFNGKEAGIEA
jgi:hypothetical protein